MDLRNRSRLQEPELPDTYFHQATYCLSLLVDVLTLYITEVSRTLSRKNDQKKNFLTHKMEVAGEKSELDAKSNHEF